MFAVALVEEQMTHRAPRRRNLELVQQGEQVVHDAMTLEEARFLEAFRSGEISRSPDQLEVER